MLSGSIVALVTPFHEDGSIHYEKLQELIEFHIANQTDGLVLLGTTGEAATLTEEERLEIVSFCCKIIRKRIPLIVGAGSNDTMSVARFIEKLNAFDIDYYLSVTPYYNKTNTAGLIAHFTYLASIAKHPIILYNVPSRTGMNISIEALKVLSKNDNIVGIKEASGNISYVAEVSKLISDDFVMLSGNDNMIVPLMSCGAQGVISVLANICPNQVHRLCDACLKQDYHNALKLQNELLDVANALFMETNPIPIKAAMNYLGYAVGGYRLPLTAMSEDAYQKMISIIEACKRSIQ